MAGVDHETSYLFMDNREALVLAGGGARAAYQAGVLAAMAACDLFGYASIN